MAGKTAMPSYEAFRQMPWNDKIELLEANPNRRMRGERIRNVADGLADDWPTCAFGQHLDSVVPGWQDMGFGEDGSGAVSAIEAALPKMVSLGVVFSTDIIKRDYDHAKIINAEIGDLCSANTEEIRDAVMAAADGIRPSAGPVPSPIPKDACKFCGTDLYAYPCDKNYAHKACNARWDRLTESGLCGKCGGPFTDQAEADMGEHHGCRPDGVPYTGYDCRIGGTPKREYRRRCGMEVG